ncbi:fimbrial protein [Escherichia coli]|uniref:fimbrial protein n=1 Tax=Escherichia coli TaxID=562 RepID=UPI001327DFBE|nr:fimbrial protein [Escherichia coli]MXC97192.1 type 1 fimbrial protein [Escherichia coli]
MKKSILSLVVLSSIFSGGALAASAANDSSYATLNFSGRVTSNLCQVSTNDVTKSIDLGEVTKTQIANSSQPKQSFSVTLNNCDTTVADISYILTDTNNNTSSAPYLVPVNTDTSAQGVGVYVTKSDGTAIQVGNKYTINVQKEGTNALPQQSVALTAYVDSITKGDVTNVVGGTVDAAGTLTIKAAAAAVTPPTTF